MKKRICLLMLTAVMICSGCGASASPASPRGDAGERVETLRLAGGVDWGAPNPYLHQSRGPGNAKKNLVFASLLEADETGIVPWMAESWHVEGDSYTFTLHENAMFHDGRPLTAEDVAFTVDYMRRHPPVSGSLGFGDEFIVSSCDVVDGKTVVIRAAQSSATTLTALGGFVILPRHIWESVEEPERFTAPEAFVGSGAYCFSAYDAATGSYEFTAFDSFCAGRPAAGRIQFVPVGDELLAFESGEIDIASMPADLSEKYLRDDAIGAVEKANDMGYRLLINFERLPELLSLELRSALYSAIDRQAVVDKVFRGLGAAGSAGYAPPGSIYFNGRCVEYPYAPDQARAVLEDRGISVTMITAGSGDDLKIAELTALDLKAAGVEVAVAAYDSAVRDRMVSEGSYELALVGNGGWGGKAPAYMRTVFSDVSKNQGGNPHNMGPIGYSNETITRLAEAQALETDFDKRIRLFQELQMEVSREIPVLVIATKSDYSIYRRDYYDGWMKTYDYQQAEQNRLSYMNRS